MNSGNQSSRQLATMEFNPIAWSEISRLLDWPPAVSESEKNTQLKNLLESGVVLVPNGSQTLVAFSGLVIECQIGPAGNEQRQGSVLLVRKSARLTPGILEILKTKGVHFQADWKVVLTSGDRGDWEPEVAAASEKPLGSDIDPSISDFMESMVQDNDHTIVKIGKTGLKPLNQSRLHPANPAGNQKPAVTPYAVNARLHRLRNVLSATGRHSGIGLSELAQVIARWSAILKHEENGFLLGCFSPDTLESIRACLLHVDPPTDLGDGRHARQAWLEVQEAGRLLVSYQTKDEQIRAIREQAEGRITILNRLLILRQNEHALENELRKHNMHQKRNPVTPSLLFDQLRLFMASSKISRIERKLVHKTLALRLNESRNKERPSQIGRVSRINEPYFNMLDRFMEQLGAFSGKHPEIGIACRKREIHDIMEKIKAEKNQLLQAGDSRDGLASMEELSAKTAMLQAEVAACDFALILDEVLLCLKTDPTMPLIASFLKTPSLILISDENPETSAICGKLGPSVVVLDETGNPAQWQDSAELIFIWRNGNLDVLLGRPRHSTVLQKLRQARRNLPDAASSIPAARLLPGLDSNQEHLITGFLSGI